MTRRPRLLVTGFGAFPGAPRNPTQDLVEALDGTSHPAVDMVAQVLPVEYGLLEVWGGALDMVAPDAILHFGLASSAQTIRIETIARNNACPYRVDAAGGLPARVLLAGGRTMRHATLAQDALYDAIAGSGVPVSRSRDAGDYLCNAILYASLDWCARRRGPVAGFIHVPDWPVSDLAPAVEAAIGAMIRSLAGVQGTPSDG